MVLWRQEKRRAGDRRMDGDRLCGGSCVGSGSRSRAVFFWLVWGLIALFCAWVAFLARGLRPNWADSKNEGLVLCEAQSPSTDGADEFLARSDPPGGDADSRAGDTRGSRRERLSHS